MIGIALAMIVAVSAVATLSIREGQTQAGAAARLSVAVPPTAYVPAPPSGPTHDTNTTISGDATAEAWDQRDREQANAAVATSVAAHQQGKPDPKEQALQKRTPPIPQPVSTTQAFAVPPPPGGITVVEVQRHDWQLKYHITNAWQGTVNGQPVTVWAGSKADVINGAGSGSRWDSPEQGLVIYSPLGQNETEFLSASRHGVLKLTGSSGTCLTLVASDSTSTTFDAATQKWGYTATKQP
jgi:hypothetical protein